MPSIRFRAPLLALSDLVTLAVLTLRERDGVEELGEAGRHPAPLPRGVACGK